MQQTSGGPSLKHNIATNVTITTSVTTANSRQSIISQIRPISTPIIASTNYTNIDLDSLSPMSTHSYGDPTIFTPSMNLQSQNTTATNELNSWQVIHPRRTTKKRVRETETDNPQESTKRSNNNNPIVAPNIINLNRFTVLNDEFNENRQEKSDPKPPPVFVQDVADYSLMLQSLQTVLRKEEFICKTHTNSNVKVNTSTSEAYRKLIHLLNSNNIAYYTYQPRQDRAYRVVIKNLHHTIPTEDVKEALQEIGFEIRNVSNMRSWKTKDPLPMFFVDQEPGENNKKIYEIKHILGTKIIVEPPRKKKEIPQCLRRQEYGHTKSYCTKPYYCVKCASNHPTYECRKSKDTAAVCILCSGPHPANYKGCTVYQQLQKARDMPTNQNKQYRSKNTSETQVAEQRVSGNISYSEIARNSSNNETVNNTNSEICMSQFLSKFETMFNQLMQQNTMIINLLTTFVNRTNNGQRN